MPGEFAPVGPPVHRVTPPLELLDGRLGKTPFDVEQVARVADIEAPREPAWHLERLLDVEAEIDEAHVALHMDLRLAVRAHAAEHLPGPAALARARGDQGVHRALARLPAVGLHRLGLGAGRAVL